MKHRDTQVIRIVAAIGLSCLTVFALGLDMSVEIPLKLTATMRDGLWGWLNNMIIALNHFHTMDHLAGLMALVACIWLYTRFLMRGKAPKGEWLLSGFFALIMLISEAAAAENTVTCLWSGGTQIIKSILYLVGMWPLFLTLLRLLHSAIEWLAKPAPLRDHTLWARHPFAAPLGLMALCWLPFFAMKYPGGMSPDVTMQILDYMNGTMTRSHPPLTTVAYGAFYELGLALGNANMGIFLFTLLQTGAFLCVLAYACLCMRRWKVNRWLYGAALAAFCLSPSYSGWATCLVKDVPYAIACMLMGILLVGTSVEGGAFWKRRINVLLLIAAFAGCWLWRRNGPVMALGCALVALWAIRGNPAAVKRVGAGAATALLLCAGINAGLNATFSFGPAMKREVYSHLLQMTGRVVAYHGDEMTAQERSIIGKVMDYDRIAEEYDPIITDGVKFLFREEATAQELADYRRLVLEQFRRYPMEYVDAYLNLTYRLFDVRSDRGDYIKRREISHPYYIRSYTNLLYDQEALSALNGAQEAVENYHFWFPDLPLVGLLTNVGACTQILLMMTYLMSRKKESRRALLSLVPALLTAVFCLGSPLVYIRYALPLTATLPLWFIPCAIQQQ